MSTDSGKINRQDYDEGANFSDDDTSQYKIAELKKRKAAQNKIRCQRYREKNKKKTRDQVSSQIHKEPIFDEEELIRRRKEYNKQKSQRYRDRKRDLMKLRTDQSSKTVTTVSKCQNFHKSQIAGPSTKNCALENDMEDYEQYKTMDSEKPVRVKPDCIPTRFDCQTDRLQTTTSPQQPQYLVSNPTIQSVTSPTQTKLPILLTLLTQDGSQSCLPEDVTTTPPLTTLFCICCRVRDVPLVGLMTCCHAEFLHSMNMPDIKPKNQVICYQCHDMLKKIKQFKLQVEESFKLLSDRSENIPKSSNQRLNHLSRYNFSMFIPDANSKKKPVKYNENNPQTIRIQPNIRFDHIMNEEKNEAKDNTEKSAIPKSLEQKDRQKTIFKKAFNIINNNQNSESVKLLANSLQNVSTMLLTDMIYSNFDSGSQFDTTLPAEINISGNKDLSSNTTTTSTENIMTYVKEENEFIEDSTNISVSPTIKTEFITAVKEENEFIDDSSNISATPAISTGYMTYIKEENAFIEHSSNISVTPAISTDNMTYVKEENALIVDCKVEKENAFIEDYSNIAVSPAILTENVNVKEENEFQADSLNVITKAISTENFTNVLGEDFILGDEIDENIIFHSHGEDVAGEELKPPVTEKEDLIGNGPDDNQESVGGGEINKQKNSVGLETPEQQDSVVDGERNVQPVGTSIGNEMPILDCNIRRMALTREQLMAERAKLATSPAYRRAPHKCESCIIGFQFSENLEDHVQRKHTRGKEMDIQCDVCRQFVDFGASYDMHTLRHHTRYQCVACAQLFASYDKAAQHHRKHHTNRRFRHGARKSVLFKCPRCPYKTRKRLLRAHMAECGTCKQCGVSFGSMGDMALEEHLISCTGATSEAKRAKPTPIATDTSPQELESSGFYEESKL